MEHVIKTLKWATRLDEDELRYLDSEVKKRTARLKEAEEELQQIIKRREHFLEQAKEVKEFIALHDTENK
jgi:recombinational DNA repair ATPase RecF